MKNTESSENAKKKLDSKFIIDLSKEVTCDPVKQMLDETVTEQLAYVSEEYKNHYGDVRFGTATSTFDAVTVTISQEREVEYERNTEDTPSHTEEKTVTENIMFSNEPTAITESADLKTEEVKGADMNETSFNDETMRDLAETMYDGFEEHMPFALEYGI